jgi:cystathionine beta-lyase/cystathionine gamma-synthase
VKRTTITAHAGSHFHPTERPHAPPIFQTTAFDHDSAADAEHAAETGAGLYARNGGPNDALLGAAIAKLEGAEDALIFSSGMGAISSAIEAICAGGHLVTVEGLYGGTHDLIVNQLPRFGVESTLVSAASAEAIAPAIRPETRAIYVESISNPLLRVADIDAIAAIASARDVVLIVDATFATPLLQRPLERGATLSIHSATKYLSGHGDAMGGTVAGAKSELAKLARLRTLHGANPDPFAAWLILRGLRTLALRVERQVANAGRIARALAEHAAVERVFYPGLESHPDHAVARRVLDGAGAMVSFEVRGGLDGARGVYDRLRLISRAASLGDVTSLMTHPARYSHLRVDPEVRRRAGITDGLLRLSVGIEDADDVIEDLSQALG